MNSAGYHRTNNGWRIVRSTSCTYVRMCVALGCVIAVGLPALAVVWVGSRLIRRGN